MTLLLGQCKRHLRKEIEGYSTIYRLFEVSTVRMCFPCMYKYDSYFMPKPALVKGAHILASLSEFEYSMYILKFFFSQVVLNYLIDIGRTCHLSKRFYFFKDLMAYSLTRIFRNLKSN